MSPNSDATRTPDYYSARAAEERRLALAATDPRARAIHREMAERYAVLARACASEQPQSIGEEQRVG
jgi:hypothetical protein